MDKIEKIRQEIERRKKELDEQIVDIYDSKAVLRKDELQKLLSFLDTLKEEPDKSLEEAADSAAIKAFPEKKAYSTVVDRVVDYNAIDRKNYRDGFIAGAEWGAEPSGDKKRLAMVRKEKIEDHINELNDKYLGGVYSSYDMAKAYAEGNIDGQKWQKEQILKKAKDGYVSAIIIHNDGDEEHYAVTYPNGERPHSITDKVKIIIL